MKPAILVFSAILLFAGSSSVQARQMEPKDPADRMPRPVPAIDHLIFLGHNGSNFAHVMNVEVSGDRAYALVGASGGLET